MLRPATPLSLLLFAAFALLLLSVLSAPIIEAIPLSSHKGVNFGVFGFCQDGKCTGIQIGYDLSGLYDSPNSEYDLPEGTRNSLTPILIIHPVAALITLIMLIMAVVAHFHSPSHSSRYLLVVFVFSFITFLVCLAAFLIDVLLFIPHLGWGSYVVLAATILVGLSGLVSCAMRRTLISRKNRRKEIAENAEMSGENYYNREAMKGPTTATTAAQPTMPVVSGGNDPSPPQFAAFDEKKQDQVSDERIPLTSRSPSGRSPNNMGPEMTRPGEMNAYAAAPPSRAGTVPRPGRDFYGNTQNAPPDAYGVRRMASSETNRSHERGPPRGRGGMPPPGFRGRGRGGYGPPPVSGRGGGYGPRGRGGYGPPPNGRGGYGPRGRGAPGYGAPGHMMKAAGRGPPGGQAGPDSYDRRPSPGNNAYGAAGSYGRPSQDEAAAYATRTASPAQIDQSGTGYAPYNPERGSLPRAESPPPLPNDVGSRQGGQAANVDDSSEPPQPYGNNFNNGIRDSDMDIAGMVGLQQGRPSTAPNRHDTYMTEGSKYSTDEQYVPPRQNWGRDSPQAPSPLHIQRPADNSTRDSPAHSRSPPAANNYYEDVDPRFTSNTPERTQPPPLQTNMPPQESYEDVREQHSNRARSPGAESDRSNFTSISQRSVNPRWHPPPPMPGYRGGGHPMPRRAPPQRQDMLLNNPDFELPGGRVASPPRTRGGMIPGSAYPQGPI